MKFLCNFLKETFKLTVIAFVIVATSATAVYALMSSNYLYDGEEFVYAEEELVYEKPYALAQVCNAAYEVTSKTDRTSEELVTESTTEPATEPVTEPATEPVTEPATEPVTEPATEPVTEPATEPVTEPATEPVTEPATEPVTEPATEPVTEPATEPQYNVDGAMLAEAEKIMESQWSTLQRTVELINSYRAEYQLPKLSINYKLCLMACYRSEEQAGQLFVSHQRADGRDSFTIKNDFGYTSSIFGEVCGQYQEIPEEIVSDWMMSPGHAAILMNGELTEIGIGVAAGSNGGLFWTGLLSG